jgi:acetone carboxylase gamma subunit
MAKKEILKLTPYVNITEDEEGKKMAECSRCGYVYCDPKENYKLYCLVYGRDPKEIQPGDLGPDKDWMIYREFYCPGCGSQVDVEATPPGTPILHNVEIKF